MIQPRWWLKTMLGDTRGNDSVQFISTDNKLYLTAENTCTSFIYCHFAFPTRICVCIPQAATKDHGICRDAERRGHQGCGPGLSKWVRQHTHTLTHWWDAAKFTPALCFNIIFRYPVLYVSNSIFCNFLLRLSTLTNKILPPAWIYFRSWATWEIWSINTNHILQIYKSKANDGGITDQSHLMGSNFSSWTMTYHKCVTLSCNFTSIHFLSLLILHSGSRASWTLS